MATFVLMLTVVCVMSHRAKATNNLGEITTTAKVLGELIDTKFRQIEEDLKACKLIHGMCAPCLVLQGTENMCDCRNLEPKRDCLEFYQAGVKVNGLYKIAGTKFSLLHVFCDQTTQGGGWTVIQRRKDGSENFYRNWKDYKNGFGDLKGEFWFGNDNINHLTANIPKKSSLLINMKLKGQSSPIYAKYSSFSIGDELTKYTLHVSGFSGNTTDYLAYHNNRKFTTYDGDNDINSKNCAVTYQGAWWYGSCFKSNLNGLYAFGSNCKYICWGSGSCSVQAKFSAMKVRRNI